MVRWTDGMTDWWQVGLMDKGTGEWTGVQTDIITDKRAIEQTDRQSDGQMDRRKTDGPVDLLTYKCRDEWTGGQVERRTDRQTFCLSISSHGAICNQGNQAWVLPGL